MNQREKSSEKYRRLVKIIEYFGFKNDAEFANAIKISKSYISEILKSEVPPKTMGQRLEDNLDISRKWFETGEGQMINANNRGVLNSPPLNADFYKTTPPSNPRLEAEPKSLASDPNDYDNDGSRFEELPDGTIRMRIPVIPHKAFAGYLRGFQDPEFYEDLNYISIDVLKKHRAHYLAFEVKGDSMTTLEPEHFRKSIFDGVKVVGRELSRHQWAYKLHINKYDAWVIVHKTEGILIKQIIAHDVEGGVITIHSLNPDKLQYPDEDLKLDDIEQIFNVVKKIDE